MADDGELLTLRLRGKAYRIRAYTNGLVRVRIGKRERWALSPNARPFGIARELILELLGEREADHA